MWCYRFPDLLLITSTFNLEQNLTIFYLWPKYCMDYWRFGPDILKPQIWMAFIFRYINFYVLFCFLCKYFLLPINYHTWNLTHELRTSYRLYTWALSGSKATRYFRQLRIDRKIKVKNSCDFNDQANEYNSKRVLENGILIMYLFIT